MHHLKSSCNATVAMLKKAEKDSVQTVWDRYQQQLPQCNYGLLGICCRNCNMGPCRIDPFGEGPQKGICGANADIIVARNLLVNIATGAAAHSDHGRDIIHTLQIATGENSDYKIRDEKKLRALALECGIPVEGLPIKKVATELANMLFDDFGRQTPGGFPFLKRLPYQRLDIWKNLSLTPRGIDREIVESMHRTHIGVDNDPASILLQGIRTALADGWAGSMIATEVSDILFGTPMPKKGMANLGVLKEEMVNIIVHGHEPVLSEMIVEAANDKKLIKLAQSKGAKGINLCGMCCTGSEILMRHGVSVAGNFLQQELAIITGVVEAMIVDVQCIFPSLGNLAKCYHTKFISTSAKAHFPQATHMELDEEHAYQTACNIVEAAVNNFSNRKKSAVFIPPESMEANVGFSVEAIADALGGTFDPLIEVIKAGHIRGIAAIVGCNNPKVQHDYSHIHLVKRLIENDVLVVTTGCNAIACAKAGLLSASAAEIAGQGLKAVCNQTGIPPVLHMGSCVDISRILSVAGAMAQALDCDISDLPLAAAAPEWMSQKAVSIAAYVLGSGIFTVLGTIPPVLGSKEVTNLLCNKIEELLGAKFAVEVDPEISASLMIKHIENKRVALLGETIAKEDSECMSLS